MQYKIKLAALAMAGGTAALVLAATPALASSHAGHKPVTVPEHAYGAVHGQSAIADNPTIPLAWGGLVRAHGVFSPNGPAPTKGQHHTFDTSAGKLVVVVTAPPAESQNANPKTCKFSYSTNVNFAALGGLSTGRFAGVSGRGGVQFSESGYLPRYQSGKKQGRCDTSPNAPELARGAVASFTLDALLTTP
jgi:hypothetical protein